MMMNEQTLVLCDLSTYLYFTVKYIFAFLIYRL